MISMSKKQDLTGKSFGFLTAIRPTTQKKNGYIIWECRCDCGRPGCPRIVYSSSRSLKNRKNNDCGCKKRKYTELDWVGKQFGKLTVLRHEKYIKGQHYWRCLCSCGNETVVRQQYLSSGKARSCGCLAKDNLIDPDNQFKGTSIRHIQGTTGERKPTIRSHSGIRGVYPGKNQKWVAQIQFQGKTYHLGTYETIEDARNVTCSRPSGGRVQ